MEEELLWKSTKNKQLKLFEFIKKMQIKDKRCLFTVLRKQTDINADLFFPNYGMTLGEFCTFQILTEASRKDRKDNEFV